MKGNNLLHYKKFRLRFLRHILIFILPAFVLTACNRQIRVNEVPATVLLALEQAGDNLQELEKAIVHFQNGDDSLKLQALYFLLENMDNHYSADYYWKDRNGERVDFDEFSYPDFPSAVDAMKQLREKKGNLYKKGVIRKDLAEISEKYLIDHIDHVFRTWRASYAKDIPFKDFCEYVLPYRATIEPLQQWREAYNERYRWMGDSLRHKPLKTVLAYAGIDYSHWFTFTFGKETRDEPLPRLGPKHLLFREKGACEDVAALEVFAFRSQGIPVAYDFVPLWATSVGAHFMNTVFDADMEPVHLDVTTGAVVDHELPREPAKVIRQTYSAQPHALAILEREERIPPNFLRTKNHLDVTREYWPVRDMQMELFSGQQDTSIVYACMFSGGRWHPMWWGRADGGKTTFTDMPRGTVVMPARYENGMLLPVGHPKVNGFNHELLLEPDTLRKRTIEIHEQESYLIFRPGKRYELFYWDIEWRSLGEKTAPENGRVLQFKDVPRNALLLLVPEYSERKERPFMITDDGTRHWW